jgi:hypothetical protein
VGAAVQAVEAARRGRAERARKRRKKDADASARRKRQQQAARDHKDIVKTVIGAAFEGASRGAVRAALSAAAEQHGVALPLARAERPAAAAAAAAAGSDSDCHSGAESGDEGGGTSSDDDGDSDSDAATGTATEHGGVALRERVRVLSPFAKGKKWSSMDKNLLVLAAYQHIHAKHRLAVSSGRPLKPSAGAATAVAAFFGVNRSRVSKVLSQYAGGGELRFDTPNRAFDDDDDGAADSARTARADAVSLTTDHIETARTYLNTRATAGSTTTWRQVYDHLKASPCGLHVSFDVMKERLMEEDFGVIPVRTAPVVDLTTEY